MGEVWRERYQELETVAIGGQARLLRAIDLIHHRQVALKVRNIGTTQEGAAALAEARTLLSLHPHPGLPTVRDDFTAGDDYVLVLDWIDGTNLQDVLNQRGSPGMPPGLVLAWVRDLADALDHLHNDEPPIIHGDIKPGNAILTPTGRVVLVDLGSAPSPGIRPGGTLGYEAPELAAGASKTIASDVYGLAATTYALLTGRTPAVGPTFDGRIDHSAARIVEHALRPGLAVDPARRPASASELLERVAAWATAEKTQLHAPSHVAGPAASSRIATLAAMAAGAAGLLMAITVASYWILRPEHTATGGRRIQGADRYATAAAVATATFRQSSTVVLARADQAPDALAALYLAGAQHAPLIFTAPDGLTPATAHAIARLHAHQAFIIGDDTAVPLTVEARLTELNIRAVRVAAPNRFSTAGVIAQAGGPPATLGTYGPTAILLIDSDASRLTAAGSLAYAAHFPILYAASDGLPAETIAALTETHISHIILPETVSKQTLDQLRALHVSTQQTGTQTGPASAAAIAHFEVDTLGWATTTIVLSRADDFPDAVATATLAGTEHAPMLLSETPSTLGPASTDFLRNQPPAGHLDVIGDPTAISDETARAAATASRLVGHCCS